MKSIRQVYKTGVGPSSSHTMGPCKAAEIFRSENPDADKICVILYGSLSKTGKGHGTDTAIAKVLSGIETEIVFSDSEESFRTKIRLILLRSKTVPSRQKCV